MSEMKWISVTDLLPEGLGIFKVLDEDKGVDGIAAFNPKTKLWELFPSNNPLPQRVTHWKRLKPQTNADRIRAMNDEELMLFLATKPLCPDKIKGECPCDCTICWNRWLKQIVKDGNGE